MQCFSIPILNEARLLCYVLDPQPSRSVNKNPRPAIMIVPGGGYHSVVDHEQECIAMQWCAKGYHSFVLFYTINEDGCNPMKTLPLKQLASAISVLRENAVKWFLDSNRIVLCGFSAGGHLAGSLAVHWHSDWLYALTGISKELIRPNALILGYPVITSGFFAHQGSFDHLLGSSKTEEELSRFSLEKQVTVHLPPCFIWHTQEDEFVPVQNSLLFASSCIEHHIPVELHIFPYNRHGLSLANAETAFDKESEDKHVARWVFLCMEWLEEVWKKNG